MRFIILAALSCAGLFWAAASELHAQPKRNPDLYAPVTQIVPATDAEKEKGIVAWVTVKGSDLRIRVTTKTDVQIQMGKLVNPGKGGDLKEGDMVSVWHGEVAKSDPPQTTAEFVIIFRPGKPDLPPTPGKQ
jgi:hypothetical protein